MDRLKREANPPSGQLASPVPQYKDEATNQWSEVKGKHDAPYAVLKDAEGNVISPASNTDITGVKSELQAIKSKDFATQATLVQVKTELEAVKAELQAVKANQLSGDQKVQVSGNLAELFGRDISSRPAPDSVPIGTTFMIIKTEEVWQTDGVEWVVK